MVAVTARATGGPAACSAPAPCLPLAQNSRCRRALHLCSHVHPLAVIQMLARCSHTDVHMCTLMIVLAGSAKGAHTRTHTHTGTSTPLQIPAYPRRCQLLLPLSRPQLPPHPRMAAGRRGQGPPRAALGTPVPSCAGSPRLPLPAPGASAPLIGLCGSAAGDAPQLEENTCNLWSV